MCKARLEGRIWAPYLRRSVLKTRIRFSAGGLIIQNSMVLLVQSTGEASVWTFPKGHIEPGEKRQQTALREVQEETGLACRIVRELAPTTYWLRESQALVLKKVWWFLMEPVELVEQHDTEIARIAWVPIDAARSAQSYESSRNLLSEALTISQGGQSDENDGSER